MMDALSAKKYYHFVRLMGRAASHITLECALQTHPQAAIICEEVHQNNRRLADIVHEVCMLTAGQERLLMTWHSYGSALAVFLLRALGRTLCLFRDCLHCCCCDLKCCMRDDAQVCCRISASHRCGQFSGCCVQLADIVAARAKGGKNYGVILLPEGLIEHVPEACLHHTRMRCCMPFSQP